jgi:hypothetical protein
MGGGKWREKSRLEERLLDLFIVVAIAAPSGVCFGAAGKISLMHGMLMDSDKFGGGDEIKIFYFFYILYIFLFQYQVFSFTNNTRTIDLLIF